jgi:hypothetical protein
MRLSTFMVTALALCFLAVSGMASLEDGLVSAWTFDDGSARDHHGNNDGTFKNGAKAGAGKKGQGLVLNNPENPAQGKNTGQYVEVPNSNSLEQADGIFSVSLWLNAKEGGGRNHAGMFWKGEKIGWGALFQVRMATTAATNMTFGSCWEGTEGWFACDNSYKEGEWTHVAYVVDGKTATAYVNNKIPDSGQQNPRPIETPLLTFPKQPVEIGVGRGVGGTVGNDFWIDGTIDEIYLWNRALSKAEVEDLSKGQAVTAVEAQNKLATKWGKIKQ